jgi:carbon-monoxide dehydrogenase large subunit
MAVAGAAHEVRSKALAIAGHVLDRPADTLEITAGWVCDSTGERLMSLGAVAAAARPGATTTLPPGLAPGLEAIHYYVPPTVTWSSGTHVAIVEVDRDTGHVAIERYLVAHDCGIVINPGVVEGQVVGGVVHGIGNALFEEALFDDRGVQLTTSLVDYHLPRAVDVPRIEVLHQEFPSPLNELGVKGCGEGGTVAAPPAIINAVEDALQPLQLAITEMPLRPDRLLRYLSAAEEVAKR